MATQEFNTDLNCASCVAKAKPYLDAIPGIKTWAVDTNNPKKILTVQGENIDPEGIRQALLQSGFKVLDNPLSTYYPLILIFAYLLGLSALSSRPMPTFMGGFFLVFSFFKFLNLKGFAQAYGNYDLVARSYPPYAWFYPFIELGLGIAYLMDFWPMGTNAFTLILMLVGGAGVLQALSNKRNILCVCLGTVFKLPMTKVTLFENLLMALMALFTLIAF